MRKGYPHQLITKKIKETDVEIIGVEHNFEFFEAYKSFYEKKINSSDAIILEQPFNCEFWETDFFSQLGKIAYKKNIPIYQTDPINGIAQVDAVIPLSTILGVGLLKESLTSKKEITRRNFLKRVALFSVGTSITYESFVPNAIINGGSYPFPNVFSYGQTDWRNVKIAKGLEKVLKKEKINELKLFHGADHTNPINFYLDHQTIREIKEFIYNPLDLVGKSKVRKYIPSNNPSDLKNHNQSWKLVEEF
ncbi:MAG: hypothetical protein QJ16_C0008G0002 [archaeon GW2011_AR1]|nr:MAG: hypothetical protein QJ16_C0008G0002 [archaeon GW2011_AR1]